MSETTADNPQRLGVLGTLVLDTIRHPGARRPVRAWGGIAYALTALDAVLSPDWTLVPVVKIGGDVFGEAAAYVRSFGRIGDMAFVRCAGEANNRVELVYSTESERVEVLTGGVPGWSVEELAEILPGLDALYVNFVAGWELDLAGAQHVRDAFPGFCYADLHSLFLDVEDDGCRRPRRLPHGDRWAGCFDAVQMNGDEFALFAGGAPDRRGIVEAALTERAAVIIVTRGAAGVELMTARGRDGPVVRRFVPVAEGPAPGDPTGCGDIWGATFFAGIMAGTGTGPAIERANRMARGKLGSSGAEAFRASLAGGRFRYSVSGPESGM